MSGFFWEEDRVVGFEGVVLGDTGDSEASGEAG